MGNVGCLVNMAALLVGCLGGSFKKVDLARVAKKKNDFRFWFASDAWRVSLFFRYPCIADILWN